MLSYDLVSKCLVCRLYSMFYKQVIKCHLHSAEGDQSPSTEPWSMEEQIWQL